MEGSRERSDAEQEDRLVRAGRFNVVEEALSVSLPPYLILSDTVLSLWCQLARRFLSQCLSPSRRRWPRPSCDRPYTSRRLEDLALSSRARVLLSLWAAIADGSHASRRASSASLRPLSCARLTRSYKYGYRTPYHSALLAHYALPRRLPPRFSPFT